jgi:hypothetical protein
LFLSSTLPLHLKCLSFLSFSSPFSPLSL